MGRWYVQRTFQLIETDILIPHRSSEYHDRLLLAKVKTLIHQTLADPRLANGDKQSKAMITYESFVEDLDVDDENARRVFLSLIRVSTPSVDKMSYASS